MAYIHANSVFFIAHWADGHCFFFQLTLGGSFGVKPLGGVSEYLLQ